MKTPLLTKNAPCASQPEAASNSFSSRTFAPFPASRLIPIPALPALPPKALENPDIPLYPPNFSNGAAPLLNPFLPPPRPSASTAFQSPKKAPPETTSSVSDVDCQPLPTVSEVFRGVSDPFPPVPKPFPTDSKTPSAHSCSSRSFKTAWPSSRGFQGNHQGFPDAKMWSNSSCIFCGTWRLCFGLWDYLEPPRMVNLQLNSLQ